MKLAEPKFSLQYHVFCGGVTLYNKRAWDLKLLQSCFLISSCDC